MTKGGFARPLMGGKFLGIHDACGLASQPMIGITRLCNIIGELGPKAGAKGGKRVRRQIANRREPAADER